jgi:7-keto-8-aminopelargonate synthetase-like enzyme
LQFSGISNNYIYLVGKKYSYFGGNNYLGLAGHPEVMRCAVDAIERYGVSSSASRQTTGTSDLHLQLEELLSEFKNRKESVVFGSGYLGNRILLGVLKNKYSAIFTDESAHPSIIDSIPAENGNVFRYKHCNADQLEDLLRKNKKFRPVIITDGVFALTGEIAPVDKIYSLSLKYDAILVTDDSHATGVLGINGRGTPEHFGLDGKENIFQSETLSKALGSYGGFISADNGIIKEIRERSSVYLASTALPPACVAAACSSIRIIMKQPELRQMLGENVKQISRGINELGFEFLSGPAPIIPLFFSSAERAAGLSHFLKEHNIIVPYITYPVKMNKFIARIAVSACHSKEQIEELTGCLKLWRSKNGIDKD